MDAGTCKACVELSITDEGVMKHYIQVIKMAEKIRIYNIAAASVVMNGKIFTNFDQFESVVHTRIKLKKNQKVSYAELQLYLDSHARTPFL